MLESRLFCVKGTLTRADEKQVTVSKEALTLKRNHAAELLQRKKKQQMVRENHCKKRPVK